MATKSSSKKTASITNQSLYNWNKWLALAFVVQGVAILVASASRLYPVTISYLGVDSLQTLAQGHTVLATGSQTIYNVNLAYVVAAFLLIAAITHALLATKLRPQYEKDLKNASNKFRWISYSVSLSTMMVAVGLVVGVQDIAALLMMFGLTALMCLLGLATEICDRSTPKLSRLVFWLSCAAGALPWAAVLKYLAGGAIYGSVPAYVYWIAAGAFLLFACVPINLYLQSRKIGEWKNYPYSERMFMVVGLAAQSLVAWLIFAGVLHP